MEMNDEEIEDLKKLLREAGYQIVDIDSPFEPLIPIKEAIKQAPKHWP